MYLFTSQSYSVALNARTHRNVLSASVLRIIALPAYLQRVGFILSGLFINREVGNLKSVYMC